MRTKALNRLAMISAVGITAGLFAIFFVVPTEDFQGIVQKIFYIHVPAAWVAYLAFAVVMVSSISYLRSGAERWDHLALASAESGVLFTGLTLLTGMLWGRPVWGTYWVWDPRLTLTLVLFLIYLGYLSFRAMSTGADRGARVSAVIGITGFIAIPLIHFSVDWWRGQHPGRTVFRPEASPDLPLSMLLAMLWMVAVFTVLYALMLVLRVRICRLEQQLASVEA